MNASPSTTGRLGFSRITWPLCVQAGLLVVIFLTDTFFLSRVSDAAVAGVASVIPFLLTGIALMHVFSDSGTSLLAQHLGSGDRARMSATFAVMLAIGLVSGVLLTAAQAALAGPLVTWMGLSPEAAESGRLYLLYLAPIFLLDGIFINLKSVVYAHGKTRWIMWAAAASAATSIGINTLLLFEVIPGWTLGPREVALATLLAQLPLLFIVGYAVFGPLGVRLSLRGSEAASALRACARRMLSIGVPGTIEPISYNAAQLMLYSVLATVGTPAVAAMAYGQNTLILVFSAAGGKAFGVGTQIIVGHLQGAGDLAAADQRVKRSLRIFLPVAALVLFAIDLFSGTLLSAFTSDPEITRLAQMVFAAMLVIEPLKAVNSIVYPSLRGSGDVRFPVAMSVIGHWLFGVGTAGFFAIVLDYGLAGVLAGIAADEAFRALANTVRWHSRSWHGFLDIARSPAR